MSTAPDLRRLLTVAGWLTAGIIAVITATSGLPSSGLEMTATLALTTVGLGLWCLALVSRVPQPRLLGAVLLGVGLCGALLQLVHPDGPGFMLAYMALGGIGLGLPRASAFRLAVVVVGAAMAAEAATNPHPVAAALSLMAGCGVLFLATLFAGASRDAHAQAQALLEQEAATRAAREEAALLGERQRLARELHDVLAHTLAGLAVQLEGARLLADRTGADPRLAEQVANAQRLAREGMSNAKRAVATLRGEALPGPADLPALVEQTRMSGLPTTLTMAGQARPLPAEAGLAVYRTVQEALTNTAKYAGQGATATVHLTWAERALTVEVTDAGGDRVGPGLPSGGYGLAGLAERAALAGGRLEAGPTPDGWRVTLVVAYPNAPVPAVRPQEAVS